MTPEQLLAICPRVKNAETLAPLLTGVIESAGVSDPAMFVAQLAHESGEFRYVRELASGAAYEGRKDLGNDEEGDGVRYKGRGYIQLTGKSNYRECGKALGLDLLQHPELLEEPENALQSAAWYWQSRGLNGLDLMQCTLRINGGYNGLADRKKYYERAQKVLRGEPELISKKESAAMPIPAIIPALLPALVSALPDILRGFADKKTPASEKNLNAAVKVFEVVKTAVGADNEQAAVEKLKNDPEARLVAQTAVQQNWYQIFGGSEEAVQSARAFNTQWDSGRLIFGQFHFVELLSLLLLGISAYGGYLVLSGDFSAELKGAVVTTGLIGGYIGIKEFWLGTSASSAKKTELLGKQDAG